MLVFSVWTTVYAVEDYTLLTPLPGTTIVPNCTGNNCKTNLETYLPGLFNWAIGIAALMAFIVITIGGVTYMTTDSIGEHPRGGR